MPGHKDPPKEYQFKPGQSGNPNGRPRKNYPQQISELKKKGLKAPSHAEFYEMIGLLMSMTEDELKDYAKDKDKPYWIRAIVLDLNNKKIRQSLMKDHRDWLFGSAKQQMEYKAKVEVSNKIPTTIEYQVLPPEGE